MKVIIFGATGLVGKSVLMQAIQSKAVSDILVIGRRTCGVSDAKVQEVLVEDLFEVSAINETLLQGFDVCIWAIGMSSVGMSEAAYAKVTEQLTLDWAKHLLQVNPNMSFCYCSAGGAGGSSMWAKVRQRVENTLQDMPFTYAGAVRPAVIQPSKGLRSQTRAYQVSINLMKPLSPIYPYLVRFMPSIFTTSENLGNAMLGVVQGKSDKFILESADINRLAKSL